MHAQEIITIAAILVAGFLCHWLAWRTRLPAILLLLTVGIAAGPVFGLLDTDALLDQLLLPMVSLAVAIILFEGSLTLKFSEMREHGAVVRRLISVGVLITWGFATAAAHYLLGWDLELAALFGAIVTVSGPTVVMPLLRAVRLSPAVADILRWEAILIDPIGAILALLTFDIIVATQASTGIALAAQSVIVIVVVDGAVGALGGYLFGLAIRRRLIPDFLRDYAALSAVLAVFAASEAIQGEGGLLAVTVMGIWLANMRDVDLADVLGFKESLTLLLVAGLFILLAARLNPAEVMAIGGGAVLVLVVLQCVAGPLRGFLCTVGAELSIKERLFVGWVFPRGIVAAAISALFALRLEEKGFAGADKLVPLVFAVIIGTVIIQSISAPLLAKLLGVSAPEPTGVLIVGANRLALAYAKALQETGLRVLVVDSHWASIRKARMMDIPVFHGSAVSVYADGRIDLTGLGVLLAVSRQPGLNELACIRYAEEFGRDNVYTLSNDSENRHEKHQIAGQRRGRLVLGGEHTIDSLLKDLRSGSYVSTTELSEEFDFSAHRREHPEGLPLFAIDDAHHIHFPVADEAFEPRERWTVAVLTRQNRASSQDRPAAKAGEHKS